MVGINYHEKDIPAGFFPWTGFDSYSFLSPTQGTDLVGSAFKSYANRDVVLVLNGTAMDAEEILEQVVL